MSNPEITVNINIPDKDIERLEKVKQLLQDIKEIDTSFKLINVIETNANTILVFNYDNMFLKQEDLNRYEILLSDKFKRKCILLSKNITLDKAIGLDYAKGMDYTTVTYYNDEGNPIKEEMIQYK